MFIYFVSFLLLSFLTNFVFYLTSEENYSIVWKKTLTSTFNFVGILLLIGIIVFFLN
ncbi:MAG: hypothetical protein ABIB46_01235 [bacterium]